MKRAVYRDQQWRTYSAPVVLHDGQWLMQTSEGLAAITLQFDDDRGGRLEFVGYRDEPDQKRRASRQHLAKSKAELMWSGHATPEEDQAGYQAGSRFAELTPAFPRPREAATLVANFMKEHLLDATRVESYLKAWKALTEEGKITPLPYQTADAFYHEHKELHPTQKPPMIQAREAKAEATKAAFTNAESNTASAGVTNLTDYPERERIGYGNHTRYSFRRLLDSLDSESYKRRLIEDPSFAAAVDKISEK